MGEKASGVTFSISRLECRSQSLRTGLSRMTHFLICPEVTPGLFFSGWAGYFEMSRPRSTVGDCAADVPGRNAFEPPVGLGIEGVGRFEDRRQRGNIRSILDPRTVSICKGVLSVNSLIFVNAAFLPKI